MQALVKRDASPGMSLETVNVPEIGPTDVLIRVLKTGICGTDFHIYSWDTWAKNRIRPPLIVGHEFMGSVEKIGEAVDGIRAGDLVSGEGHLGCGRCFFCRTGRAHICRDVRIIGVDRDGCFANFLSLPAANVWKLSPEIPADVAAVLDPLGNAMHTVMAQPVSGKIVAVVGAGAIGLMACQIAAAAGAISVWAVEPQAHKRAIALRSGAARVFDPAEPDSIREIAGRAGVVLEMSGSPAGIRTALDLAEAGGEVALLGIPSSDVTLNLSEGVIFKGLTLRGINGRKMFETWYECERFLAAKKLDICPLITHRIPFQDYEHAFELLKKGEAVKILLEWE